MKQIRSQIVKASDLQFVAPAPTPDSPPLMIGELCRLNSGSPPWLIVDADADDLTIAYIDEVSGNVIEHSLPRACVRRGGITA